MPFVAVTLVLVLFGTVVDQGAASVIVDRKAAPSNPAVEGGGRHLSPRPPAPIPYSLIGALASEGRWFSQCAMWSWRFLGSLSFQRVGPPGKIDARLSGHEAPRWPPPPFP